MKILFLLLIIFLIINKYGIIKSDAADDWKYSNSMGFEGIVSPIPLNRTLQWGDLKVNISTGGHSLPTQILGTNIPLNSSVLNNLDLTSFFSGRGYANFLTHFNCKNNAPTCIDFKFSEQINDVCVVFASVDGYDRVTVHSEDTTSGYAQTAYSSYNQLHPLSWKIIKTGSFNNNSNAPECQAIMKTEKTDLMTLGCFGKVCENPNFIILKPNTTVNYLKICYDSYSTSEYVQYSFARCSNPSLEITRQPLSIDFSIAGVAFEDLNKDGKYDQIDDRAMSGVIVELLTSGGAQVRTKYGFVQPVTTNIRGSYLFRDIARGAYRVKFTFKDPNYKATTKSKNADNYSTSKINPNYMTDVYIVSNTAAGVRMTDENDEGITTDRILPGINAGVIYEEEINESLSTNEEEVI